MDTIDFVVLWVDGNDPKWLEDKMKYSSEKMNKTSNGDNRYRDWEMLKYWFRGVEKNASWVNKIYFVTYGHIPSWLDTNNPKLKIVKHDSFIPHEYLPTFNSNVIQFYLDRIEGLSEKFVLFDDDIYIVDKVKKEDFFVGDYISDNYGESMFYVSKLGETYPHTVLNNLQCVFEKYDKRAFYRKNWRKIYSPKNGLKMNIKTLSTMGYTFFIGLYHQHTTMAYTKEYYKKFWDEWGNYLKKCSENRFRNNTDITTLLIRYMLILDGKFVPRDINFGYRFELSNDNSELYNSLRKKKYKVYCINDSYPNIEFEKVKGELISIFESLLPEKSSFEK